MHGPVVPDLYRQYKVYGSQAIPRPVDFDPATFNKKELQLLDDVYDVYGQYSAWKLRQLTHSEQPWKDNYSEGGASQQIPTQEMKTYFRENLVN
jgi:uncharacterized phage-associated protein